MSVPSVFTPITDRDGNLRAFKVFKGVFSTHAQVVQGCHLGWSGGTTQTDVYWHEENRIWGVLRAEPPQPKRKGGDRFWNCFGISEPRSGAPLNITVEINRRTREKIVVPPVSFSVTRRAEYTSVTQEK